jgi:hypothetical protein
MIKYLQDTGSNPACDPESFAHSALSKTTLCLYLRMYPTSHLIIQSVQRLGCMLDGPGFKSLQGQEMFLSCNIPHHPWVPPSLLANACRTFYPESKPVGA